MEVTGAGALGGPLPVQPAAPSGQVSGPQEAAHIAPEDTVEISDAARLLEELHGAADVRAARLEQIRLAIAEGRYETPEILEVAVEKLLAEIQRDG